MEVIVDFQKQLDDIKSPVDQQLVEDFGATKSDPIMNINAYSVLTTGQSLYESKKEELEKTGQVQLGDLYLYDYGQRGVIVCID